jgi:hypothetical protein
MRVIAAIPMNMLYGYIAEQGEGASDGWFTCMREDMAGIVILPFRDSAVK